MKNSLSRTLQSISSFDTVELEVNVIVNCSMRGFQVMPELKIMDVVLRQLTNECYSYLLEQYSAKYGLYN